MLAAGAEPLEAYPGVNARWKCRCLSPTCPGPTDRTIYPRLGWVRRGAQACKWCAGVVIDAQAARDLMITLAGLEPEVPYPGVREPWQSRCLSCNSVVYPRLGSITSHGSGCSECASYGFQRTAPAYVYFLTNSRLNAAKVGICNIDTGRIEKHVRRGWECRERLHFEVGRTAELLEKNVLAEWRAQGWGPVRDGEAAYDGWTETVAITDEATAPELWMGILELHKVLCDGSITSPGDDLA